MTPSDLRPLILLADDDGLTAAVWTAVLRLNGFEVVWEPKSLQLGRLCVPVARTVCSRTWNMSGINGPAAIVMVLQMKNRSTRAAHRR
jgi:hypothetical protein